MSGKIVVGFTGESASRRAVDWAVERAVARKQSIELLSVVAGPVGPSAVIGLASVPGAIGAPGITGESLILEAATTETENLLAIEAARIARDGLTVTTRLEVGDPVSVLVDAADEAELLVIGSDYRGPGEGPARGSHGIRIVADAKNPVVVVPDFDVVGERSGVVVGVDGSPVSEAAIAFAAAEADRLGEPLTAVIVWTPISAPRKALMVSPQDYRDGMEQMAREALSISLAGLRSRYAGIQIEEAVAEGYPAGVINVLGESARLIVVGSRGRGAVRRFLLGSISHDVLQRLATVTAVVR